MRQADIEGLSAAEIAKKFNIPDIPTQLSRADIPAGTKIRTGVVGPNKWGDSKGAIQYEILKEYIPESWFKPLKDF